MTDERIVFMRQAEGILQLRAAGENLALEVKPAADGRGRVTARAPQNHRTLLKDARHRIIRTHVNAPVVQQERSGYLAKPRVSVAVFITDRLIRQVAASHHQRAVETFKQQMMQRRVRQHKAKCGDAGRNRKRND